MSNRPSIEESAENHAFDQDIPTMGLNDNLEFMGKKLHVQTENMGFDHRYITTHVFCNGRVVLSTKSEYPPDLHGSDDPSKIQGLMRKQHFDVIRKIEGKRIQVPNPI